MVRRGVVYSAKGSNRLSVSRVGPKYEYEYSRVRYLG